MRASAAIIGTAVLLGLILQIVDVWQTRFEAPTLPGVLWYVARYFTILTNGLIAVSFLAIGLGRRPGAVWTGGLVLWILITGIVYHLLLAGVQPNRLAWWADVLLHSVSPVLVTLWWVVFAPKTGVGLGGALSWLLWPALYCGYALLRGLGDGVFPYFFLDPGRVGWSGVLAWIGLLLVAFALGALVVLGMARVIERRRGSGARLHP